MKDWYGIKIAFVMLLAIVLVSCQKGKETNATEIQTVSAMRKVMMGEDLSAHILWDTIARKNLYAVCPLGRIEGEITIVDGKMYAARVNANNTVDLADKWDVRSPFAVYAYVREWEEIKTEAHFSNDKELQEFIEKVAKSNGKDLTQPFVFRIVGDFETIKYHIISKPEAEMEHDHEAHDRAKRHFTLQRIEGEVVGFYSQSHEGIFTHRGNYIHAHFVDAGKTTTGHLEQAIISGSIRICISR